MIKHESPIPKYLQLKEILHTEIAERRIKVNEQLPPESVLARQYRINRLTVRQAIKGLVEEGVVQRIQGKGTFVIHPESEMRDLFGTKTSNIGVGLYDVNYITTPSFAAVIAGASGVIESYGYHLQLSTTNPEANHDRQESFYEKMLNEKRVDGLLIMDQCIPDAELLRLKKKRVPFVLIDRSVVNQKMNSVRADNKKGVYDAVTHLIRLGHKKIAFVSASRKFYLDAEKRKGYQLALKDHRLRYDERYDQGLDRDEDPRSADRVVEAWLQRSEPPSAIFATGDTTAYGILAALKRFEVKVPDQMALVGYDDALPNTVVDPPLTSVHVPYFELGKLATEMLFKLINKEPVRKHDIVLKPDLIVRDSCGREVAEERIK